MNRSTQTKMNNDPSVTFLPVGNGDSVLVSLADGATIMIDCDCCVADEDKFDVKAYLLDILSRDSSRAPHLNVFLLTHPDQDHCRGFSEVFFAGAPEVYADEDRRAGRILIDELWFAPRVFNEFRKDLSEDAQAFCREADRRIQLYKSRSPKASLPGNRLRLIEASDNEDLNELDGIRTCAGQTLNLIDGKLYDDVRIFVLAPAKKYSDDDGCERNDTSVALQVRFDVDGTSNAALVLLGGDTSCEKWEDIVDKNSKDQLPLKWDLLLAPHHCSWYFFSDEPPTPEAQPNKKIMRLLEKYGRDGAFVVASSKPILDDGDDPPSCKAKGVYEDVVGKDHFLCTGDSPDDPIRFVMTANGPRQTTVDGSPGSKGVSAGVLKTVSTPRTYG